MVDDTLNKREIKSFAMRRRKLTGRQAAAFSHAWDEKGIQVTDGLLDFSQIFGREADRVLEIGFGNGDSLWQMAQSNPDKDYVGMEVHTPGVANLLISIIENDINNIQIVQDDAVQVLRDHIPDNTFTRVQIFFPDPWHKKRHHKRRLIQPEFVQLLCSKLKVGGVIHCATDWEHYAAHMMEVLSANQLLSNQVAPDAYADNEALNLRPNTKFEQRGVKLGHGVWDLLFEKTKNQS